MSEFSMFYKLFGCMHACILHVLSVRLIRVFFHLYHVAFDDFNNNINNNNNKNNNKSININIKIINKSII